MSLHRAEYTIVLKAKPWERLLTTFKRDKCRLERQIHNAMAPRSHQSRLLALVFSLIIAFIPGLSAAQTFTDSQLLLQRKLFVEARTAIQKGKSSDFEKLLGQLDAYPLTDYLEYYRLINRLSSQSDETINQFLAQHNGEYLGDKLRLKWLKHLAAKQQWWRFVSAYDPAIANTSLKCQYSQALMATGLEAQAFNLIPELWLHGKSRPSACDTLFNRWLSDGKNTEVMIWQRLVLAADQGNLPLSKYLLKKLPEKTKTLGELLIKTYEEPARLAKMDLYPKANQRINDIVKVGLKRLVKQDSQQAWQLWQRYQPRQQFATADADELAKVLGLAWLKQDPKQLMERWSQVDTVAQDPDLITRRLRKALFQQDWALTKQWLNLLPTEYANKERWQYWKARYLAEQGQTEPAQTIFTSLAQTRTYYGFMSAERLQQGYELEHAKIENPDYQQLPALTLGSLARAKELMAIGELWHAKREWRYANSKLEPQQQLLSANWALDNQLHQFAVRGAIKAKGWDYLDLRFPLAFNKQFEQQAKATGLDTAWLRAIARQESALDPHAKSRVGATGLMQLMPQTAKAVSKKLGVPYQKSRLTDADFNIYLGSSYLAGLHKKFSGNGMLAAASYNAGPHRTTRWLARSDGKLPADIWVETIPFRETRGYVQNVMTYQVIYRELHKLQAKSNSQLVLSLIVESSEQAKL